MDIVALLQPLAPAFTLGVGTGGSFYALKWLFEFVAGRRDKRESALDAGWREYRRQLETDLASIRERLRHVEEELHKAREERDAAVAEAARLGAILQGKGEGRLEAQRIVAVDRQDMRAEVEEAIRAEGLGKPGGDPPKD